MDSTDPDITFTEGVCNHCLAYDRNEKVRQEESKRIKEVYAAMKGEKYDCILGLSGGVDSSLCLHYLVRNGKRPLCFSVDNGWNTPESDENIMRLVEGLKVPFFRYTIDLDTFRNLQSAFIQSGTANIEIPTDHIIGATAYEMANKYGIKTIVSGGNLATESIMPAAWGYNPGDLVFIKDVYKKFTGKKLKGLPLLPLWKYNYYRWVKRIKTVPLLDYYEYNREGAKRILETEYGWKDYGEKHNESVFTSWFQSFYLFEKFGYDKRKAHYSSLINSGQMTKKEAIELLMKEPIYPKLGIELKVMKYPRKTYKDYKNNEKIFKAISRLISKLRKHGIVEKW